jgi:undecaprenyl phosphate N,N'-diacetylbacillosamine 1-phosphate transferase
MYLKLIKPLFDFIFSLLIFIALSPFFITCAILLFFANAGNPFFFQQRPGKSEKIFTLIKFKTMNDKKDQAGNLLSDEERLTAIGKFIRKTSLDEIPQLLNVIKSDMSLIGPRPLLIQYLPLYNTFQKRRHEVKPGITGWAQINGRNAISWQQKFEYDVWYIDNVSFLLDCKIIFQTIYNVLKQKNISQLGNATVEYFKGNIDTSNDY